MTSLTRICLLVSSIIFLSSCASIISVTNRNESIPTDPTSRSTGAVLDDGSIETVIAVNLNAANDALRAAHISVISYNGLVLLVGQVPTQELKNLATQIATSASSRVKTVHNELEVAGNTSLLSRSSDTWITAKVKTQMLANENVSGLKTKVVTSNGVVYLMGITTQQQANTTSELASHVRGVVKVVRAFEYIN